MNLRRLLAVLVMTTLVATAAHAFDRKQFVLYTGAATDTTAVGMADSTSMLPTSTFERLYLHLKANVACRVAIQIRQHGITDSSGASLPDSNQTAVWPWRTFTATTADTMSLNQTISPLSDTPASNELVVTFKATPASKWGSPRGILIPLCDPNGAWYHARTTSIRLRVLSGPGVVTWVATLEGVSW